MPRFDDPIVVVTRPERDARRFLDALLKFAGPFDAVISPAFDYTVVPFGVLDFDIAIFTSAMGVAHAPIGEGRIAYCVGTTTAKAAKAAGYVTFNADGSADDLVALILSEKPTGRLLHIRGENSLGNVMNRLVGRGIDCRDAVVYRKSLLNPTTKLTTALGSTRNIILPVFSAETVSIMVEWSLSWDKCTVVAISESVAEFTSDLSPQKTVIAERPSMASMVQAVTRLIA